MTLDDIEKEAIKQNVRLSETVEAGELRVAQLPHARIRVLFILSKFPIPDLFWQWAEYLTEEMSRQGFLPLERANEQISTSEKPSDNNYTGDEKKARTDKEQLPWECIDDKNQDRKIVQLYCQGDSINDIAKKVSLSPKSVNNRLSELRRLYNVNRAIIPRRRGKRE
jgi:hypothetical protein